MNHRTPLVLALGLALGLATPLAFAQTTPAPQASGKVTWAELDADGDGMLSSEEATGIEALGDAFDAADDNDDGLLTAEEYREWYEAQQPDEDDGDDADADADADANDADDTDEDDTDDGSSERDPDDDTQG